MRTLPVQHMISSLGWFGLASIHHFISNFFSLFFFFVHTRLHPRADSGSGRGEREARRRAMPCKPGGEITLVPSLREICLETIRSNLQHLVGVKALPSIFKQEILQPIWKEIKSRRRCELKWAYFVSLSRSVKKFVVQSVPCKTLATKVLNIRPKGEFCDFCLGQTSRPLSASAYRRPSPLSRQSKKLEREAKKAERHGKQFKVKKDRYERSSPDGVKGKCKIMFWQVAIVGTTNPACSQSSSGK